MADLEGVVRENLPIPKGEKRENGIFHRIVVHESKNKITSLETF